ncbi:hypothetical protein GO013_14650 [Pseudodesulfovibrio sp. JC047]|uniref:hypothetical protein n=1 Tax=Pseudodesulfovibrio sp. JC047 TaxID=2683199 RepID=UPI0013D55F54|nr:hypothetical protein [Pseudodesulfovibrio sp. JC047]NDV20648.1 hypothetical protein [Pseudodesulfovibrio sp. JC047]
MKLNILAEKLDTHACEVLDALRSMGVHLSLFCPESSTGTYPADLFETIGTPLPEADAILCIPTPSLLALETPICSVESWKKLLTQLSVPVVLDASRLPLSERGHAVAAQWTALLPEISGLIVRDPMQLDILKHCTAAHTLTVAEYLRHSCVPRHVATDINWLLLTTTTRNAPTPVPPSTLFDTLLNAPCHDVAARDCARSVLQVDPLCYPALVRLHRLNVPKKEWTAHGLLHAAQSLDRFSWLHEIQANEQCDAPVSDQEFFGDLREYTLGSGPRETKRILLFVVYKQRDLFIDLLLMAQLERLGHEVILRPLNITTCNSIVELRPDLIIWGARTTPIQRSLSHFAADRGILQVVRREEGLIYRPTWDERSPEWKSLTLGTEDYSPYVDLEIGFNEDFRRIISTEGHMPGERVRAVGAMTFDIYDQHSLNELFPDRKTVFDQLDLDLDKKLLIMASPWSYADRQAETAIPEAGSAAHKLLAHSQKIIDEAQEGRAAWFAFMRHFCHDFSDEWNVLLKVHPGERIEAYDTFIADNHLPIKTICDGYMIEILRHCDMLLHAGSTTSVEAHLLGIPSIAYWVQEGSRHPLHQLTPIVNTYEDFLTFFSETPLHTSTMTEERLEFAQNTFWGTIDGHACERAAKAIDDLIAGSTNVPYRFPTDAWTSHTDTAENDMGLYLTIAEIEKYTKLIKTLEFQ